MYLFVPFFIILIGLVIRNTRHWFSIQSVMLGLFSSILVYLFGSDLLGKYVGLYQRVIEIIFALWIILCSLEIKKRPYKSITVLIVYSSGDWTRTSDLRVMSPTSYLLLYPAMWSTNIRWFLRLTRIKSEL